VVIAWSNPTKEVNVPSATGDNLLEIILDSWDRNNRILVNLLRALPPDGLEARVMAGSPSVAVRRYSGVCHQAATT
jgi:hypothetical protein